LNKAGVQVDIWPVKANELPSWVEQRMRIAGLKPEREAVRLLADLVEGNLLAAQQEIEKLALLNKDGAVTTDLVRASVANSSRFDAFRLGECLLVGKSGECLKVASGLQRTGVAIQMVGAALSFQLTQLSSVRSAVNQGANEAQAFGRFRVFKMAQPLFRAALRRVSDRQLMDSFRALALLDRQGKGRAAGDPWQTLDQMLLMFCAAPGEAAAMRTPWS
jgi:DNA polymerase-3 subunit delta